MNHPYAALAAEQRARPGQPLQPVELDILRHLAAGRYDTEIARALEISTRSYRRYITALLRKLHARTRAHAVAIAIQQDLIVVVPGGRQ